jgi:predicted nucleic acid-binding protein
MRDKVFIDTNIFIYSALEGEDEKVKREKAIALLKKLSEHQTLISTQVLNEFHNTLLKHNIPEENILDKLNTIINNSTVLVITVETIKRSWALRKRYRFSLWDALIIASALENNCSTLYTEDLQHNQLIEN